MFVSTRCVKAIVTTSFSIGVLLAAGCARQSAAPAVATLSPVPSAAPTPTATPAPTPAPQTVAPQQPTAVTSLDGQWEGALDASGTSLTLVLHFITQGGAVKGTLDVPQQSAKGIPLNTVAYNPPNIAFDVFSGQRLATYEGAVRPDGIISGTFKQAGFTFQLILQRVEVKATLAPPYRTEEVTFASSQAALAGTLSLPDGAGPHPAVVLISGSGPQDRDEEVAGFPVFAVLADHLTRSGMAVLRYDDRGVGKSSGDMAQATSADFAGDVAAAVHMLKTRSDIDPQRIGLLGHSEGGIIAPMVVSSTNDVAFVVLMAGPGVPGKDVLRDQVAAIMKASGATQAQIDEQLAQQARMFEAVLNGQGMDQLKAEWRSQIKARIDALTDEQRKQLGDIDKYLDQAVQSQVDSIDNPWFRFFLTYDPAPALRKTRVPVLALFGELDTQVVLDPNRRAVEQALQDGGNPDYAIQVIPAANHLFQSAVTGSPDEYAKLDKTFAPGFLDSVTVWLQIHAGVAPR